VVDIHSSTTDVKAESGLTAFEAKCDAE